MSRPTRYWRTLPDGRAESANAPSLARGPRLDPIAESAECTVCPRFCKLRDGQRGLCFVRANEGGAIVLTTFGRSSGYCIDPIEKKPLNHFLPGTPVLSFGTAGCNLACKFCQNWDISKSREFDRLTDRAEPETIARMAHELGCRSVAYTYNDPVVFLEYAIETARACRKYDIRSVAVTAGYVEDEPRRALFSAMDAANVDLKAFTDDFYFRVCGGRLQPVLDTLVYLRHETRVWLEITTLLIPGMNDSESEIDAMTRWGAEHLGTEVPWHFTAFHGDWKMRDTPSTPPETLTRACAIARANGHRYVYTGNVQDEAGGSTFCASCGEKLIGRDWHRLTAWGLDEHGRCGSCGASLPGVFDARPGTWGGKRLPVRLSEFLGGMNPPAAPGGALRAAPPSGCT